MKKTGFTLIELLAVVAILAVLAIIALPNIIDIYNESKERSFENEVKNVYDSARSQYMLDSFTLAGGSVAYTNAGDSVSGVDNVKPLSMTGRDTFKYYIYLSPDGKVLNIRASDGKYSYSKKVTDTNNPIKVEDIDIINNNEEELESDITSTVCPGYEDAYSSEPVIAAEESCFNYTINNNEVTITGYDRNTCSKSVVIPSTIEGHPVKRIADEAFSDNNDVGGMYVESNILSVIIPNTVVEIGDDAFFGNGLTSLTIPSSVTTIGEVAFAYNYLTSVVIPNSVTSLGYGAFENNQLTSVTISNKLTKIERDTFSSNLISSLTIPLSVIEIEGGAFRNNKLSGNQAFIYKRTDTNNDGIAEIDYTTIVDYGGDSKSVTIPNTVVKIGDEAFSWGDLTSVTIPSSVTTIGEYAFAYNDLTSITISSGVTTIGQGAFENNKLTSVTIPSSVITIGIAAFERNNITSLNLPNSVTSIGYASFRYNKLTSVTIPSSLTSIGSSAFEENLLTSITIPSNVTSIDYSAFKKNKLTSVIIKTKTSSSQFTKYGSNLWGWDSGVTCVKDNTSNVTNGCITWGAS